MGSREVDADPTPVQVAFPNSGRGANTRLGFAALSAAVECEIREPFFLT
jgi:hypothetical protein